MERPKILEAAIVQRVRYASKDEMYRVNAKKALHGQRIVYKRIDEQPDGSVIAMIMFRYNSSPLLDDSLGMNQDTTTDCDYCKNAYTDEDLNHDNDLSYMSVGKCNEGHRAFFRTGAKGYTALLVEQGNEPIWEYHPKFCPNCGRRLLENELKARGGRNNGN